MKKMWLRFCGFVFSLCFLVSNFTIISFASDTYHAEFNCYELDDSTLERLSLFYRYFDFACTGTSAVYMYSDINGYSFPNSVFDSNVPLGKSRYYYDYYFVSDAPFEVSATWGFTTDSSSVPHDYGPRVLKSVLDNTGFYIAKYGWASGSYDEFVSAPSTGISFDSATGYPWQADDFVPGEGGITTSSIVYDSSIPAPQNLRFKSESVGGFLGIGAKFEHELSWSNGLASPPLYARISAVASTQATADDVPFEDSTVSLLSAETTGGYPADTGVYRVGTDEIASKILPGTSLNKVLEYRIQFYRYVDDKLNVGPVATVHLKTNLFGKYDGYTVTTEYPKDPDNIGDSGGSDDFYDKDWSSDGQNYQEYDKDGNLIGSGTSEDSGNPVERLLKSLKDIPKIISSTFKAIFDLMSGVGQLPTILSQLFSFLPPEIIIIVGLGITVAIALRIVGR